MANRYFVRTTFCIFASLTLAACEEGAGLFGQSAPSETVAAGAPGEVIERDVEAPEVFSVRDAGLWDGRPSLGGVWVAHPDVKDPERVIIRNEANGNFVIGALFRRERNNPGPSIQVSSDAAAELGMLAGQPSELNVVALRREQITIPAEVPQEEVALAEAGLGEIESQSLDPIAAAAAAIETASPESAPEAAPAAPVAVAAADPAPASSPLSSLDRPYIQIGIFSIEKNAENTGASLRTVGVVPTILRQESKGKTFWRVIVGPANTADERAAILAKVRELGFSDAYFVTN